VHNDQKEPKFETLLGLHSANEMSYFTKFETKKLKAI